MTRQERLNRLTCQQHGLVTSPQAVGLGFTLRQIEDRLRRFQWLGIRPGVYAVAGMPPTRDQALMAVTLAIGGRVAVSHRSAAGLWAMKGVDAADTIEVLADLPRWVRLEGVTGHRSGALFDEDLAEVRGIAVTSRARTLVDLSGSLSLAQLRRTMNEELRRGLRLEALQRCAARLAPAPGRRMKSIHTLLAEQLPGYDPGDSDLETRVLRLLTTSNLPPPRQQLRVRCGRRKFKLDLAYPDVKVAIELDGWEHHQTFTAFHDDRHRDALLASAGWVVVHFSARTPDHEIVTAVTSLLARFAEPAGA